MFSTVERPIPERRATLTKALPETRTPATVKSARIAIRAKGRILFIDAADVIAVEARGNYVSLLHTSSSPMLRESISIMEEKLNRYGFVRIHRSVLVNGAWVEEIHPRSTGEYVLRVRGGREFTVTRTYKPIFIFWRSCGSVWKILLRPFRKAHPSFRAGSCCASNNRKPLGNTPRPCVPFGLFETRPVRTNLDRGFIKLDYRLSTGFLAHQLRNFAFLCHVG
jgi:hypothetical protein